MKLFNLKQEIYRFYSPKDFSEHFTINSNDLILTHEFLYNEYLKDLNLKCDFIFQEKYGGEPTDSMIDKIIKDQKHSDYKRIFAIGGGSVIDIAKILALKNVSSTLDLFERKIPAIKDKELIVVPTTCGTGSEVTNISIAFIESKGTKMGLAIDELFPDYAVLIPSLLENLPFEYFVYSSMDALIHACESYLSPKANPYTEIFSIQAIEMILNGYSSIITQGKESRKELIESFLIASNYAGIAFGNAGVGAVHALSYPLGGNYHVPHGEANYQFFTEVFKLYNKKNPEGKITYINKLIASIIKEQNISRLYNSLDVFLSHLIAKKSLRSYGMKEEEKILFTDSIIEKQQRLLGNNYVPLSREEIFTIYSNLF